MRPDDLSPAHPGTGPGRNAAHHIVFDLDGTLVDSCATCVEILSEMLAERGSTHVIDAFSAREHMSRGGADMVAALLGEACVDPAADLNDFRARYLVHRTAVATLYPGVAEGLERLRQAGFMLSICSNKPQGLCEKVLADIGLADHFAVIVGGQGGMRPKPAPDLLAAVLARSGTAPAQCLFIGDSELDYQVACDAGMPFHFLTYGYAQEGWLPADGAAFACFATMVDSILATRPDADTSFVPSCTTHPGIVAHA